MKLSFTIVAALTGLCALPAMAASTAQVRLEQRADGPVVARIRLPDAAATTTFAIPGEKARFVVDFARPVLFGGRTAGSGAGLGPVTQYRFAPRDRGSRLVFDLASSQVNVQSVGEAGQLQFEFVDESKGLAAVAAPAEAAPLSVKPAPAPVRDRRARKVVVVDAGHGGRDSGAIGASGAFEKDVTLAAALSLRTALEARGFTVVLTRDGDEFLELSERVGRARAAQADLFISLHADSSPNKSTQGASIYTLSESGGARAKSLAQANNWDLDLAEPVRSAAVEDILMDLAQRETKNRSSEFAQVAVRHLEGVSPLLRNSHRNAGFFVLLAPDVPAILLEMGFMTNAADEKRLTNAAARRTMMNALADAAAAFLGPPRTLAEAQ